MRVLRLVPVLSFAFLLVSCDKPPTAIDEAPQLGATHLTDPSEWEMVAPWTRYDNYYVWVPCANGGEGADGWWSAEMAAWGKIHETPSGNYIENLRVGFRNAELRIGAQAPDGVQYPFVKVVQQNVTHSFQQDGRTLFHMQDSEFYTTPDGRNVKVQYLWHWVIGGDGRPAEMERLMMDHCSPGKW
jgi:hypothetical protein